MTDGKQGTNRARVEEFIQRIEAHNERLNAMILVTPDIARAQADEADRAEAAGKTTGALHGMVVALKDNIDTQGLRTTSGSKLFEDYIPDRDAEVWRRMRAEGAILIGKAGLHECVFGPTSQNAWYGRIHNPWDDTRVPGGSSGGSGSAVAAGFCDLALGTDTGGSVRIPAALCGLTGLRPTVGAVSNDATRPISPHFDTTGPMAIDARTTAQGFAVMQGYDAGDETSRRAPAAVDLSEIEAGVRGLKIGIPTGYLFEHADDDVIAAAKGAAEVFAGLGAELVEVEIDGAGDAALAAGRISVSDAANYYQYDVARHPNKFSQQVMARMLTGYMVTGREYGSHFRTLYRWRRRIERVFEQVDMILSPTLGCVAPPIAESDDLLDSAKLLTGLTMAWTLARVPVLAFPSGFSGGGSSNIRLPLSVQLAGPDWSEALLFRAAVAFQGATDHHGRAID